MENLHAFDDARLNADLSAILRLTEGGRAASIDRRPRRWRDVIASALRSPRASATIGVSVFVAMLGTTAFLMAPPRDGQLPASETAAPIAANSRAARAEILASVPAEAPSTDVPPAPQATADGKHGGKRLLRSRRKTWARRSTPPVDVAAVVRGNNAPPVVVDQGSATFGPATDLAQNVPPAGPREARPAVVQVSDASTIDDGVIPARPSAQVRRNTVAAIRAFRRQW